MKTDAEILDWLERMHTLHTTVEALYVVDGYRVQILYDEDACFEFHGDSLRDAYTKAMRIEYKLNPRRFETAEGATIHLFDAFRNMNKT